MMQIRPEQFEAFERKAVQDFEDELVAHLKAFSPGHAAGDEGLRALVRSGLRAARTFGFERRGSLRFYVECQATFGHEFHADPLLPWPGSAFADADWADELDRADDLYETAMEYRAAVIGEDEEIEAEAWERLADRPPAHWLGTDPAGGTTEHLIAEVYPAKVAAAPPAALPELVGRGYRTAPAHHLPPAAGGRVLAILMALFGHGVLTDPLHPWVAESLRATAGGRPHERAEGLARRAITYLTDGLAAGDVG